MSPQYQWTYDTVATDPFVSVERPSGVGFRTALLQCRALCGTTWYLDKQALLDTSGVTHRVRGIRACCAGESVLLAGLVAIRVKLRNVPEQATAGRGRNRVGSMRR